MDNIKVTIHCEDFQPDGTLKGPRIGWMRVTTAGKPAMDVPFGLQGAIISTDMGYEGLD